VRINLLLVGLGADKLGGQLDPSDLLGALGEGLVRGVVHESHLLPGSDDLAESTESHGTSDKVLTVLETVVLLEDGRVSVGVADEVVGGREVVWLGGCPASQLNSTRRETESLHQVLAGDLGDLAVLEELAVVVQCHEHTSGGPRELVAEGVVRGLHEVSLGQQQKAGALTAGSGRPPQ
jgi:hypothetical protein